MSEIENKLESIEKFKQEYVKRGIKVSYEDFDKYFYAQNFFLNSKLPYIEEKFNEILIEITINFIKNYIQELEYYVNVKPTNPLANSDLEILRKENETITKYYYKMHINYKTYHKMFLSGEVNTKKSIEYLENVFGLIKEFNTYSIKLQDKLIENIKIKLEDIKKNKDKKTFESSIYH